MTKLTTREVTDSHMLMEMIAKLGRKRFSTLVDEAKPATDADPCYDVRVSINGVDLDFKAFQETILAQLDRMVAEEAGELVKKILAEDIQQQLRENAAQADRAIKHLTRGVRDQAAKLLGYDPMQFGDES